MNGIKQWRSDKWFAQFAPDNGAGNGGDAGNGGSDGGADGAGDGGSADDNGGADGEDGNGTDNAMQQELARLKAEFAKQKAALDAATSEAGKYKRELRAKQTAEEAAAEEKKAEEEKTKQEIENLRREVARTKTVKSVMSKLGTNEDVSGKIAEYLYGAEDAENALALIQQAWNAKEKALRLEFGKIPPPGAGGANGEDAAEAAAIELAKKLGKERATQNVSDGLKGYMR